MGKRGDHLQQLNLFLNGCSEKRGGGALPKNLFKAYYGFITDALGLIQGCFTEKEQQLYAIIVAAREQELTPWLSQVYMDALHNYREHELGLKPGFAPVNERDAVTNLLGFAFTARTALQDPGDVHSLWREIEEFSDEYFQFFGHANELVELFHSNMEAGRLR
jgi:hypothetical protein